MRSRDFSESKLICADQEFKGSVASHELLQGVVENVEILLECLKCEVGKRLLKAL